MLAILQNGGNGWTEGLSFWMRLITFVVVAGAGFVGYKINTELFKTGGVVERLNKHDQKYVKMEADIGDHERRIGKLEDWKDRTNYGKGL